MVGVEVQHLHHLQLAGERARPGWPPAGGGAPRRPGRRRRRSGDERRPGPAQNGPRDRPRGAPGAGAVSAAALIIVDMCWLLCHPRAWACIALLATHVYGGSLRAG